MRVFQQKNVIDIFVKVRIAFRLHAKLLNKRTEARHTFLSRCLDDIGMMKTVFLNFSGELRDFHDPIVSYFSHRNRPLSYVQPSGKFWCNFRRESGVSMSRTSSTVNRAEHPAT